MVETYSTASVSEAVMEAATIIKETIGGDAENMDTEAEEITDMAMVDVVIIIMATIATEMITTIPASSRP